MKPILTAVLLLTCISLQGQAFWRIPYSFPGGPKTAILALSDSTIVVGTASGILRTTDEAFTFDNVLPGAFIHSLYYSNAGVMFAGGLGKMYRSYDDGVTWDSIQMDHPYPVWDIVENSLGHLFTRTGVFIDTIGFEGAGVYVSQDGGDTWAARNNGLTSTLCAEAISIDRNDRLYVGIADDGQTGEAGLFYSDDGGLLWTQVSVRIDGQGTIPDQLRIYNISGINVSPNDSIHISLSGAAVNIGVNLNLHKSILDLTHTNAWNVTDIAGNSLWFNDSQLHGIHFAQNGDRYSSTIGSLARGKTWFSPNASGDWFPQDQGLGLDISGRRNIQQFSETSTGRIYMIQRFAELIHYIDTSRLTTSTDPVPVRSVEFEIFPVPATAGDLLTWRGSGTTRIRRLVIRDLQGKLVQDMTGAEVIHSFQAPSFPGTYVVQCYTHDAIMSHLIFVR